MKKADRSGAQLALVLGENELAERSVGFKPLRGGEQRSVSQDALADELKHFFAHEEH
jgi:histidyl-tRNA synthetase